MVPQCSVCNHPERKLIENVIASGGSARKMAVQYGVSQSAIQRHKLKHLMPKVQEQAVQRATKVVQRATEQAKAAETAENEHLERVGNQWLTRLETFHADARRGIERAEADPDKWTAAAGFISVGTKICDTALRASGVIGDHGTTINVAQMLVLPQAGTQALAVRTPAALPPGDIIDAEHEEDV